MKFRQFEFRLFPKIKNKKKKKAKFCDPDFPRDIGLDKNFNYSKSGFHGYYDNLAAEDTVSGLYPVDIPTISNYTPNCDDQYGCSCYKTYPLPELKIQVGDICACAECTRSVPQTWLCLNAVDLQQETPVGTPVGTPNTIPRTRTRIKTNPWLPSPRATPAPSPTETVESILFASGDVAESYENSLGYLRTDGNIGYEVGDIAQSDFPQRRNRFTALHGLVQIAELEDDADDSEPETRADNVSDFIHICGSRDTPTERITVDIVENSDYKNDKKSGSRKRFSLSEFLQYDTEDSCCTSPVTDDVNILANDVDILARVGYSLAYEYEDRVNELLENSSLPRDETFKSIQELMESESSQDTDVEVNGKCADTTANGNDRNLQDDDVSLNVNVEIDANEHKFENGDDKNVEMTALDLITKAKECVPKQTDDNAADDSMNLSSLSNPDLTCYEEGNMHESIDTGYASVTRETDSFSSADETDDAYNSDENDIDLEWDNEPSAESLIVGYTAKKNVPTQTNTPFNRLRSRSFGKECFCRRRRSRSLADIELSLDEKVTQLREEKLYVQRKIREAIEEEEIRRRQLKIFRSVSVDNRKEMLLRTLHDLKMRLENQSIRLQTSYDTVLSLQKRFSQRRRHLSATAMEF